jgi:hypothetical protein
MSKESGSYKEIIVKLERKTKREYAVLAAGGALFTILLTVSFFFIYSLIESIFHFSSMVRTIMFFILVLIFISSTAFLVILPLLKYSSFFRKTDYYKTAADVGRYYPSLKDDLVNAMQLVNSANSFYYSPALIDAAFRKVYERSKGIRFEEVVNFSIVKNLLFYTTGLVVVMAALLAFVPGLQASSGRLYNFEKEFTAPPEFTLKVYPGNAQITKGDNLLVRVITSGKIPDELSIAVKSKEQSEFEFERISSDSSGVFEHTINSVRSSLNYYVFSGETRSDEYIIEVLDKPLIKGFEISVNPPAYSGLPDIVQKDNGNISALAGSMVHIRINSNKELQHAELQFGDSLKGKLNVNISGAAGTFKVVRDDSYRILITDLAGINNESPVTYSIRSLADNYPFIEMIEPAEDVNLSNDNRLPLALNISDDFGFSKLVINYRLSESRYETPQEEFSTLEIPLPGKVTESDINYIWNLSSLSLGTNDVLSYYAEIFDNDRVSGPKSSKTPIYNVRVPSLEEILASADKKQNQVTDDIQQTLKEAEELKKTLDKIDNDLKQDKKELTWQEKEKLESALDKFEQLQDKMSESGKKMDELKNEMQKNDLLSKETLEKYMELQELFNELSGDEYKNAMEKLRDQLQKMDRKTAQDQLQNMKINEENFRKSLERTLNLFKRVKIEQKMDDLVKRAEEMDKALDEMLKENQQDNNSQKQQQSMTDKLKKMEEELKKLQKEMESLEDMPKEDLEKIAEEFEKQNNDELSKEAAENMQQKKMQQAKQKQSQLSKNMKNFSGQMKDLQQQMQQQNQMETFTDMMKVMENLITLSKQQEELKKETLGSENLSKNAEKQSKLQRSLDNIMQQLGEMSQKTFAITPEMGKALGDAKREMMKSMEAMQARNSSYSANLQSDAMKSLNEAASMMQGSMESMMQGGGQGGMMSLMQQLGQMGQQQMGLNNLTQKLRQGGGQGDLTPSEQAELQRIQQQQDLIKKSLEELNKEARRTGESKRIPANLENIVKQMEEVISDMNTQRLDDQLIQKQERILSRLLDASRSLNERDFEKKRESNTGENIVRESPSDLNLNSSRGKDRIKDELNRAVNEGYKKDYENLIKRYFEELQKENNGQKPGSD